jgi:hypothetical protein
MWGQTDAGAFAHGRDLLGFRDATCVTDVRLRDVKRSVPDRFNELAASDQSFTGRNSYWRCGCQVRQSIHIFRRQWLFDKQETGGLDRPDELLGQSHGCWTSVAVHHDVNVWPNSFAQAHHHAADLIDGAVRSSVVGVRNRDDLDRAISSLNDGTTTISKGLAPCRFVDRAHLAEAEVGVGSEIVADFPAEQSPNRHVQMLAEDVPERGLDPTYGGHADDAHPEVPVSGQDLEALLDVAWISSDDQRSQVFDGPHDGSCFPLKCGFAPPSEPRGIRLHTNEHPVPHHGVAYEGRNPRYSHTYSSVLYDVCEVLVCMSSRERALLHNSG